MKPSFSLFTTPNGFYLYDRNKNSIVQIVEKDYLKLKKYFDNQSEMRYLEVLNEFQNQGFLLPHEIKEIKHPSTESLEDYLNRKIEKITLQVTQNCNLRCDYCVYSGIYPNRTHSNKTMSFETAKKCIDYLFNHSCEKQKISVGFYGGEPLLEFNLIKRCVEYIEENYGEKDYVLNITTNGTLLDENTVSYLFEKNFVILISLDGPREIHDKHRRYVNGRGSFDDIMRNMELINKRHPERKRQVRVNTVVSPNSKFNCLVDYYDTDVILDNYSPQISLVSGYATQDDIQYDEQFNIRNQKERMKALLGLIKKIPMRKVSRLYSNVRGEILNTAKRLSYIDGIPYSAHPGGPCIAGLKRLFATVDGSFYPCERVSETSKITCIGNVNTGIDLESVGRITNIAKLTEDECKECWAFIHCSLCVAMADAGDYLSRSLKLSRCDSAKANALNNFMDYCFCVENGVNFEERRV